MTVRASDLSAVLEFVELAWANTGRLAFPLETLEGLARLIPCDEFGYAELDRINQHTIEHVGSDGSAHDDALFWGIVGDHPLCRHQQSYLDFSAKRLSDVVSRSRLVRSRVYADWFAPDGIAAELEVGIARSRRITRNFVLSRTHGDFSDRDVAVLQMVAPHLARIHEMSRLRGAVEPADRDRLTAREGEILELVAAGLTNAAIAERLWISPGTVKKHLDNVYAKLGVANRAAAVAQASPKAQPE